MPYNAGTPGDGQSGFWHRFGDVAGVGLLGGNPVGDGTPKVFSIRREKVL